MNNDTIKCWICGQTGNSKEHMIKASDIRSIFPEITQENPVLLHTSNDQNFPVGSAKSDKFKFKAPICEKCNTNRTSPHDKAWENVSKHLLQYDLERRGNLSIRMTKIFKSNIYMNALNVHLFFVKLFGCRIIESGIPVEITSFSCSIMNNTPNPYLFLRFKKAIGNSLKSLSISPVHVEKKGTETVVAAWMYSVGQLNVELLYAPSGACNSFLKSSFNPLNQFRVVRFDDFEPEDFV